MQLPLSFHGGSVIKTMPANAGDIRDWGSIPGLGQSPEKEMAAHSSVLVWEICGQRILEGYIVQWVAESDMTEATELACTIEL